MSINRETDKEDVIHIYNGILLSHKKEPNCAICSDVDGPTVKQSEVSQKEKNKYHMLRRKWQPTSVFLPGDGQRIMEGSSP